MTAVSHSKPVRVIVVGLALAVGLFPILTHRAKANGASIGDFTVTSGSPPIVPYLSIVGHANGDGSGDVNATGARPALSFCTTTGAQPVMGGAPLQIQCGDAMGMSVHLDGCEVSLTAHVWLHSDNPFVTYLGPTTVDMTIHQDHAGPSGGTVSAVFYTPKDRTEQEVSLPSGVAITTCTS